MKKKALSDRDILIEQCLYDAYCERNGIVNEGWWDNVKAGTAGALAGMGGALKADAANSFKLKTGAEVADARKKGFQDAQKQAKIKSYAKSLSKTMKDFVQAAGTPNVLGGDMRDVNDIIERLNRVTQGLNPGYDQRMRSDAERQQKQQERQQQRQNQNQGQNQGQNQNQNQNQGQNGRTQNGQSPYGGININFGGMPYQQDPRYSAQGKTDNQRAVEQAAQKKQQSAKQQKSEQPEENSQNKTQDAPQQTQEQGTSQQPAQPNSSQQQTQNPEQQKKKGNWYDRGARAIGSAAGSVMNTWKNMKAGYNNKKADAQEDLSAANDRLANSKGQATMLDSIPGAKNTQEPVGEDDIPTQPMNNNSETNNNTPQQPVEQPAEQPKQDNGMKYNMNWGDSQENSTANLSGEETPQNFMGRDAKGRIRNLTGGVNFGGKSGTKTKGTGSNIFQKPAEQEPPEQEPTAQEPAEQPAFPNTNPNSSESNINVDDFDFDDEDDEEDYARPIQPAPQTPQKGGKKSVNESFYRGPNSSAQLKMINSIL